MLRYVDFVPRQISEPGLFSAGEHESLEAALIAANQWLSANDVELIHVETVVLPNIWSRWESGSDDASLVTSGENPSRWHQIIRCWYRERTAGSSGRAPQRQS